jgi:DNA-binding beta-propeller fold protein YncE
VAIRYILAAWTFACLFAATAAGDDLAVETMLDELDSPSAVAVRPGGTMDRFEIFVAERAAGQIIKWVAGETEPQPAIVGFQPGGADEGRSQQTGLQAIHFLDPTRLVVIAADQDRTALVRSYELRDDAPVKADAMHEQVGVAAQNGIRRGTEALRLHDVARTLANDRVPDLMIVTATGDERERGLWKVPVRAGTIGDLLPFAAETQRSSPLLGGVRGGSHPTAIAVSNQGYVAVAQAKDSHSELAFYNPIDGARLMQCALDLTNIAALAYSPQTGNLYAAAVNSDEVDSGIYRIDDESQPAAPACKAIKVADIKHPTAMAFAPDGTLYVSAMGDNDDDTRYDNGVLLKITGNF